MSVIIFIGLEELMDCFRGIQVAQKKVKKAFENADSSSRVELIPSRLILTNPEGIEFTYALRFQFAASNNEAEYEALIAVLRIAAQMGVQNVHVLVEILTLKSIKEKEATAVEGGKKAPHQGPTVQIIGGNSLQTVVPYAVVKMCWTAPGGGIDIAGPFPEGPGKVKLFNSRYGLLHEMDRSESSSNNHWQSWDNIVCCFGLLGEIVSDNGKQFTIIPAEIGMPTYRTAAVDVLYNDEELRLNLDLLEERHERAAIREAKAKLKMIKYYNARVRGVIFRPGDFVYRSNDASHAVVGGKLGPKWEGPYEVTEALGDGAYKLRSMDETILPRTWNIYNLKRCYL
uniref:Reverse transcriptase domain-containing protein n=1 Tax=Tanacetum cinerariifolium TaxID=118510 RepID=A0A699H383_TANCI|nr:reverse transcriptase domain-containing protein [Tanacetum cinerariifolium]